jgi:type VI secretion system protein ImpG
LISHLSLNYLTLADADEHQGAKALRELLALYADFGEPAVRKQIDGIRSVTAHPVVRRLPTSGPLCFGRGLEVTLVADEADFEGLGAFLIGAVLEQFFARYVSLNSFTETLLKTDGRGEIIRWPTRTGQRHTL